MTPRSDDAVPSGVLGVVRRAAADGLLSSVEAMAGGLTAEGWTRAVAPGIWQHPVDPAWTIISGDHAPNASIFFSGDDGAVMDAADRLRDQLDRGVAGPVTRQADDDDWNFWTGGDVTISLNASSRRQRGAVVVRAMLQLAIELTKTPHEGLSVDPERSRRIALTGTPLQRWYLAADRDLPDDVRAILRNDPDPQVSAAMDAMKERQNPRE